MREVRPQDAVLTRYARSLIRLKARQLTRYSGFTRSDQEDLEQELWTRLLTRSNQFDPDRASIDTFIDCVVNVSVRMILRDRRRRKRAERLRAQSLDATSTGSDQPLIKRLSESDRCRRHSSAPSDEQLRAEDREATEFALNQMPDEVSDVCRQVMRGTVHSAARELGTSRRQIRNKLAEAREWLEQAGFSDF